MYDSTESVSITEIEGPHSVQRPHRAQTDTLCWDLPFLPPPVGPWRENGNVLQLLHQYTKHIGEPSRASWLQQDEVGTVGGWFPPWSGTLWSTNARPFLCDCGGLHLLHRLQCMFKTLEKMPVVTQHVLSRMESCLTVSGTGGWSHYPEVPPNFQPGWGLRTHRDGFLPQKGERACTQAWGPACQVQRHPHSAQRRPGPTNADLDASCPGSSHLHTGRWVNLAYTTS